MTQSRATPSPRAEPEADRRRSILRAAVEVFATKGYHGCRIADVARQAGVAYGLVYHYFKNKEELLQSVFADSFGRFASAIEQLALGEGPVAGQIERLVAFALEAYQRDPRSIRVLILEIARSPAFREAQKRSTLEHALEVTARLIARGQERGELRADVQPSVAASVLFGALELTLTGFVLGTLESKGPHAIEQARRDLLAIFLQGMSPIVGGAS